MIMFQKEKLLCRIMLHLPDRADMILKVKKSLAETVTGANELHFQLSSTVVSEESQTISSESSASPIAPPIRISGSKNEARLYLISL